MKKITSLVLILLCAALTAAAQVSVQGVPRRLANAQGHASKQAKKNVQGEDAAVVSFDSIQYWVGNGQYKAALIVKWNDGDGKTHKLAWGYKWGKNDEPTGEDMLRAVAKEDPRFYLLIMPGTAYGSAIGGFGFDANGNGHMTLLNNGVKHTLVDGVYETDAYDFDDWTSSDSKDYWNSGWYSGYWSYYTTDDAGTGFSYSSVGASSRELEDGSVDGWSYCADMTAWFSADMSGSTVYVSQPTAVPTADYTQGVFIVNEDWYGHQNSTVNFLTDEGEWVYRAVQTENGDTVQLGCTAQYGQIYGGKFYIMSKQAQDPGATVKGGRVNIFDATTLKVEKQMENISVGEDGKSNADGRGFLGVDEHKGYIGSSNGIYILDLDTYEIKGQVDGTGNGGGSAYDQLYSGQVGSMVRVNDRVFAVHQKLGLLVINAETDKVDSVITAPDGWGFGSVVLSKDGNLWLSVADQSGSGMADNRIVKLDPNTLEEDVITLPDGIYGPANSWYAWTPDCFCASNQQNALYWNGGENSWFCGYTIYKYDIDKDQFSTYLDFNNDTDGFYIYGCSFRIDPVSDEAYVSLYKGFGDQTYVLRKYDTAGNQLAEYPMIANYWFPSLPVFPDNEDPVIANPVDDFTMALGETKTIDLSDLATDADNFQAAIVKTVKAVSDASVLDATMKNGQLTVTPKKVGTATVTLQANSNGKLVETTFNVNVTAATGIAEVGDASSEATETARFSADGMRLASPQRGINIVRMSDGTTRKVVVK